MNRTILFTPVGGTDPISSTNGHDGSMLHICRQYKPDEVVLYMSKEMLDFQEQDNRYLYCLQQLAKLQNRHMDYKIIERRELTKVHEFDYFYNDFRTIIMDIYKNMDETDRLLLNISSGTPAMKSGLLVLQTIGEYPATLVQVTTPEQAINEHVHKDYDVKLLKYSENVIFKITFKEAFPVVFRIHRPGYHNIEELEGEILWMDEIHRDTDVELPVVYRGRDGRFLQKMTTFSGEEVYVSLISFLEGSPLGELKDDELIKGLESLGEITAKLHMQSINRDKSVVIKRFYWDINNLFGDNNDGIWGSWRDYKALTKEQYRILEKCTSVMKDKLNHYGRSNEKFGLIHADLHFYNVINNNGVNQIIDFDDSGYGFYMYDMGCALVTYSRNLTKLEGAWVRGYEKVRKLSDEDKKFIPMFVLLRRITRLAWLATHSDSDTAKTVDDEYLDVTIDMAKEWLKANTRVAVITGAAGGIGYGIAKKFLESCK